jgi:exosortase A-associated hydrolase 2
VTAVEPFFLPTPGGPAFAVLHLPAPAVPLRGHVLVVPPFNEEMNRCRSMVTLQARALAQQGFGTLLLDLHGTGDSAGEHGDARWSIWLDNLKAALQWLAARPGGCVAVLGIRLGAILAAELLATVPQAPATLVLWQPVVDGKIHMNQFLRVRMAAQLDRPNLPKETTASMRKQLEAGECIEVAGYELHPELVRGIDAANLVKQRPAVRQVLWLENVSADGGELPGPAVAAAKAWADGGIGADMQGYVGPAFWQVHERVLTPSIIHITTPWLAAKVAA